MVLKTKNTWTHFLPIVSWCILPHKIQGRKHERIQEASTVYQRGSKITSILGRLYRSAPLFLITDPKSRACSELRRSKLAKPDCMSGIYEVLNIQGECGRGRSSFPVIYKRPPSTAVPLSSKSTRWWLLLSSQRFKRTMPESRLWLTALHRALIKGCAGFNENVLGSHNSVAN